MSAYHLHGNFGGNCPSNGTGIFLAPKTEKELSCTIYKIPVKFSLSLDMKPGTSNRNKWFSMQIVSAQCFPFTGRSLYFIPSHKVVVLRNFCTHKNCFELFLSAHFKTAGIFKLNLTLFVVYVKLKLSNRRKISHLCKNEIVELLHKKRITTRDQKKYTTRLVKTSTSILFNISA